MKKRINGRLFGISSSLIMLTFLFAGITQAKAATPNILVGPDLSLGSTNQNVVVLQGLLSETGYLNIPMGVPLGYYGGLTKNAVGRYQSTLNVTPTAGYYGDMTKNAMRVDYEAHDWLDLLNWE